MSVSCRAHGCIFLSFLLKRQKITTVGSERQKITTVGSERQKKSAMGRSVPKRWAQVDFTGNAREFSTITDRNSHKFSTTEDETAHKFSTTEDKRWGRGEY
jgi:hypothetical protein